MAPQGVEADLILSTGVAGAMDIVISAVTHRTGSTLLQRIFCARPATIIWGEHAGVLGRFLDLRHQLRRFGEGGVRQRMRYFGGDEDPNQWIATMAPDPEEVDQAVTASTKALLDTLYMPARATHDTVGFKEVRYGAQELALLRSCYRNMQLVLLVREPVSTWKSITGFGAESFGDPRYQTPTAFATAWRQAALEYIRWSQEDPRSTLIAYDALAARDASTIDAVRRLARLSAKELLSVVDHRIRSGRRETPEPACLPIDDEARIRSVCGPVWEAIRAGAVSASP